MLLAVIYKWLRWQILHFVYFTTIKSEKKIENMKKVNILIIYKVSPSGGICFITETQLCEKDEA